MPTLDFEADNFFAPNRTQMPPSDKVEVGQSLPSRMNSDAGKGTYQGASSGSGDTDGGRHASNLRNWEKLYAGLGDDLEAGEDSVFTIGSKGNDPLPGEQGELLTSKITGDGEVIESSATAVETKMPYQLHQRYVVSPLKSGFLLIDQQLAHERILFEEYLKQLGGQTAVSQKSMFPVTMELPAADAELLGEMIPNLQALGFELESFGGNSYIIHGIPAELAGKESEQRVVENLLEQYKSNLDLHLDGHESLARALARGASVKRGQNLDTAEMRSLIDRLFACEQPRKAPNGKRCFITFELDELDRRFEG
jgi:DNA mismatch repair protein MutL